MMKVNYRISDTETIEIEVSDEIALTLEESYREEDSQDRKWRYHNISLDALDYEGSDYAAPDTPESIIIGKEEEKESDSRYLAALALLTETQRRRMLMLASGVSEREIARREGANPTTMHESIAAARKKLVNYYENTPTKPLANLRIVTGQKKPDGKED